MQSGCLCQSGCKSSCFLIMYFINKAEHSAVKSRLFSQ
uniref:Uncharacterized protein n=1 Tax=Anguilla anguilla TaxID=7936 RepID=A0A0E9T2D0_ANGAN